MKIFKMLFVKNYGTIKAIEPKKAASGRGSIKKLLLLTDRAVRLTCSYIDSYIL